MKTKQTRATPGDKIRAVQILMGYCAVSDYESAMLERVTAQLCREICSKGGGFTRAELAGRLGMPESSLNLMMDGSAATWPIAS